MSGGSVYMDSEHMISDMFSYASFGMAAVGLDGTWRRVNEALCDMLGYSEEELLAMTFKNITHPDDLAIDLDNVQRMIRGEISSFKRQKRYIHKQGHIVWVLLSSSIIRDEQGQPLHFVSQITDISELKFAEEELRSSKERLEFVIQGTGVGLWDWQVQTGETVFNERWAEILGYTLDELEPINIETWNRLAHPEDLLRSGKLLEQHFAGETEYYVCEARMQHKDGHWVWVLDRGKVAEWDAEGKPIRMAGTHLDITKRKQAEFEASRYNRLYATISQVNKATMRIRERKALFAKICEVAVKYGHFLLAWIAEVDHATGNVSPVFAAGEQTDYLSHLVINLHDPQTMLGPTGIALREGKLAFSQDIANNPQMTPWRTAALANGFRSSAAIPLRQKGEIIGALSLYAAEPDFFNHQEEELLDAIGEDISFALDTMQAESEAQSTRELFFRIFQLSPVAKALVRLEPRVFVDINPAFERLYGRNRDEILGKSADQLNIWADRTLRDRLVNEALLHGSVRDAEFGFYNADGEPHTGLIYADIIHHENEMYILSNTVDITERKRVENSLRAAQEAQRLQISALEAAANAIMITDRNGLLEWVNPAFTTLTGYSAAEAVGKNLRDLVKSGKQDHSFYRDLWQTITAGKVWRGELINCRKTGTEYIEEQTITPVHNEAGEITHYVALKMDVTRDREIQTQIQRQERLAAIGQLAAGIAHDFNNIMAVIVLYSQITARSPHLSDRERERLRTIHQQADHAAHMIRQILDFSRQGIIKRQPLDLVPILKEHTKLLQRTLPENIDVRLSCEAGECFVLADPTRIQQTVMNLAVNARDAMPTGGALHIKLKGAYFTSDDVPLAKMERGNWVCLSVTDTGTGIPTDDIPHLFEPFFTTKPPGKGTGLGLPQVYGIVSEHGGYITVDSQVGTGTTFTIYLPELTVSNSQPDVAELADLPHGSLETVLVVEDNPTVRAALVEVLQQLNYRTQEAADGEAALALLATTQDVDVILTDLVMPKMGGTELVRALHAQGDKTPIVVITGHPLDNDIEALHALGIDSWLTKPPTPEELSKAVAKSLIRESSG